MSSALKAAVLGAIRRNPGRDHEAVEFVVQFSNQQQAIPPMAILTVLQELMAEGAVEQREYHGQTVYGLPA